MIYYITSKTDCGIIIDSVSEDYTALKNKFPNETIYFSDKPILSVYIVNPKKYVEEENNPSD